RRITRCPRPTTPRTRGSTSTGSPLAPDGPAIRTPSRYHPAAQSRILDAPLASGGTPMPDPLPGDFTRTAAHVPNPDSAGPEPSSPTDTGDLGGQLSTSRTGRPTAPQGLPEVPGHAVEREIAPAATTPPPPA